MYFVYGSLVLGTFHKTLNLSFIYCGTEKVALKNIVYLNLVAGYSTVIIPLCYN